MNFWSVMAIGFFIVHNSAYAQETPITLIEKIYSFYQPKTDGSTDDIGFDRTGAQSSKYFSPDFYKLIKEDEKLTSEQQDGSAMDYDFLCNCQDTMDGLIVRNIQTLQETLNTARIKVSFDFIVNGSDNISRDDMYLNDYPGQEHTYFNLIKLNNHWFIDDVTDVNNVGIKKGWKEELREYYHSSIQ